MRRRHKFKHLIIRVKHNTKQWAYCSQPRAGRCACTHRHLQKKFRLKHHSVEPLIKFNEKLLLWSGGTESQCMTRKKQTFPLCTSNVKSLQLFHLFPQSNAYTKLPSVNVHTVCVCASVWFWVCRIVPQNHRWYSKALVSVVRERSNKKMSISPLIWLSAPVQEPFSLFHQNNNCSTCIGLNGVWSHERKKLDLWHVGICFTWGSKVLYAAVCPYVL